ncbi:unnamed protein product [Citrullus colocynthis]|uniref:Uncharacterized protein n=1 Tax=Citrullus colocynthis TaxID=252529 RepID=A0ABP0YLX1_9ROSI
MESYLGFWLWTLFRQEAAESGGKRREVGGVVVLDENGHRRLGHPSDRVVKLALAIHSSSIKQKLNIVCLTCPQTKQTCGSTGVVDNVRVVEDEQSNNMLGETSNHTAIAIVPPTMLHNENSPTSEVVELGRGL